ncbi:hypothetical protein LCGC14_2431990, partial [marine sediment metagenome]
MKVLVTAFFLLFSTLAQADIVDWVIYAGDTPLTTDCRITQTGPMELTVEPCTFTTIGKARIFNALQALPARIGVGALAEALRDGKAEWMPAGLRIRAWLQDKQGNVIERSVTYQLPVTSVMTVPAGDEYYIYLEKVGGE